MKLFFYRLYLLCIAAPLIVVLTILTGVSVALFSLLIGRKRGGYWPPKIWSMLCCWLTFVTVSVKGRDNIEAKQSYVFVANHQGAYDIWALYGFLGHYFTWMMKKSLIKFPVVGWACWCSGQIFVDNSSAAAIKQTMQKAEQTLSGGMSLMVFPEGSRSFTGKMGTFHKGAFQLALEFQLPVVPITIDGAFDVMARTTFVPHWGHIEITIHKPIAPPRDEADRRRVIDASFAEVNASLPSRHRKELS